MPRALEYLLFVLIFSLLVGAGHYYLWHRLVRLPAWPPGATRVATYAAIGLAVSTPVGLIASRLVSRPVAGVLSAFVYGWIGFAFLLLCLLAAGEVATLVARAGARLAGAPLDDGRRTALARIVAGSAALVAAGFGIRGLARADDVVVERVRVAVRRFPAALGGFKIVQLTDLHIGPTLGKAWLDRVVDATNALEADVIAITGDLVDGSVADLAAHVAPLGRLRARHGVFFVTGNHEYYSGADAWIAELQRLGVRVLRNEHVTVGSGADAFELAGVDDWSTRRRAQPGHRADLAAALAGCDPTRAVVLLAHQPKQVAEAAQMGVGLQISGHTHGGQIFPWGFLVKLDQRYLAGLAAVGETMLYVSRGTGYWGPPMRVGAEPEVTLLELHAA